MTSRSPFQAPTRPTLTQPAPEPAVFFETAHRAFRSAAAHGGVREADFVIGGQTIRLCFAGEAWLPQFTTALAHRAVPPVPRPDLTLCIWDDASTGATMPPPAWSLADFSPRGEIATYCDDNYHAGYQVEAGLLSLLDARHGLGLIWTANAAALPRYELTFPARSILYWWAERHGLQMVHAGAVGYAGSGVLLVGKGGSGKSSTALACLAAGMDYAGDDYVLVSDRPAPRAHSLYCSGKLHADHLERFPALAPLVHNRPYLGSEKALLYLDEHHAPRLVADLPLSAIVLPRVAGARHTTYHPVSAVQALAGLAPSTLRQLPGAGQTDYQRLSRLAQRLPAYVLDLGSELETVPAAVMNLMAEAGR